MGKGFKMIIFYKKANILSLPYSNGETSKGSEDGKIVDKPKIEYFDFIPGRNNINIDTWLKIVEYNKDDMDYYKSILTIFRPKIDDKTKEEVGEEEEKIDISSLDIHDMLELIENTTERDELSRYYDLEKERKKPRTPIIRKIKKRDKEIEDIEKVLKKE